MTTRAKRALAAVLLGFVAVSLVYAVGREARRSDAMPAQTIANLAEHRVIAYYFHGNFRCQNCLKIENYSAETIKTKFADQLRDGRLEWQVVNVEEPGNSHFIRDYALHTKSLVLVEVNKGNQIKWKNLEKVWEYLGDKEKFGDYVQSEVRSFLAGG